MLAQSGMLLVLCALVTFVCEASEEGALSKNAPKPLSVQGAFAIGDGFEGTASDWTEYFVWSLGVCGLLFHLSKTMRTPVETTLPEDATIVYDGEPAFDAEPETSKND